MKLLDKFEPLRALEAQLGDGGMDPTRVVIERLLSATEALIEGRRTILAGTNNYLGLTFDPECVAAGHRALDDFGTGTTGSRMANGSYAAHLALEQEIADFYRLPYAMVFSTGYAANLGTLWALLGDGDAVLLDADAHASLYDGCRLCGADVYRFKHNDPGSLEKRLKRLGERAERALIVSEGMYSVLGDLAPLDRMVDIKDHYGAYLFVDEAHSLGVFGERGTGLAEALGVVDRVDFIVGTFSKSLGATGGFCASPHPELNLIRYASRPYIFTASPTPSVIATTHEALRQLRARPELRQRLWANAERLFEGLRSLELDPGGPVRPVVGIRLADRTAALEAWRGLLENGVYTNLILPPASPDGGSYLRLSIGAAHTTAQIDTILEGLARACEAGPSVDEKKLQVP